MRDLADQLTKAQRLLGPCFPAYFSLEEKEGKFKVQKKAAVQWKQYQSRKATAEEIQRWHSDLSHRDNIGIALATGEASRILVVDVEKEGLEFAEKVLGVHLSSPIVVNTQGGGKHYYYKWAEELRNTAKIGDAPIDFRGDGGLVIIPPSKISFKEVSGEYSFEREISDMSRALLPELPSEIKALLSINKTRLTKAINLSGDDEVFSDGERNFASTVAIRKLLGQMPQDLWLSSGWYAFNHWCATYCSPPLDPVQIKATFDWWVRINAKDQKNPEDLSLTTAQVGFERIQERKLEAQAPQTGYPVLDDHIRGWIPGHLYVLTGETNAGKTAAACNFAHRVSAQGKSVAYFALEPDVGVIEYIAGIHHEKTWDTILDENLTTLIPNIFIFKKETHVKLTELLDTLEKMPRKDLIIIDHIGYFTNDSDDRRSQTQQESDAVKRIIGAAKKHKCAIMMIAHPRKGAAKAKSNSLLDMNDISGSAAFKQDATDILMIHMQKDPLDPFGMTNAPDGTILLPKVKTGKSGSVPIRFIPNSPMMIDGFELATKEGLEFIKKGERV